MLKLTSHFLKSLILVAVLIPYFNRPLLASDLSPELEKLIANGGFLFKSTGQYSQTYNADTAFIPASTLKILTCLEAISTLGKDFRFKTLLFLDKKQNLYIKGQGDPFLTSESTAQLVSDLKQHGLTEINNLILDDSYFKLEHDVPGSEKSKNPYDTENSALAVNFNTIAIKIDNRGQVISSESQTPTIPLMKEIGAKLPAGKHRINIHAYQLDGTNNIGLRYVGELLRAQLRTEGISVKGTVTKGIAPADSFLFHTHQSTKSLYEIAGACLLYSNNFIANQLYLSSGVKTYGQPATWGKAQKAIITFSQDHLGFDTQTSKIVEGSGLSRENLFTPRQFIEVLEKFSPFAKDLLPKQDGMYLKTGTMAGVYCYAGYLDNATGLHPFVIFLNQPNNTRDHVLQIISQTNKFQKKFQ